ncbi:glycosyltransferase family 2 protein [Niallia nealsonii]|nr:glycosyltransferase family A protein [Niallia nealsonii]
MKISVIVPTYNTDPEALKRLIGSIDAQTMSKEEYELIFIDDGSTTNIFEELTNLANKRSNMIVKQIPNSGWGSRPRNIATKMANGHYVLYLDHDDYVYPEAFERVYNYGISHGADVVNAKEVRTNGWSWGWDQFKENNPAAEKLGIQSLLPMTPHKFYRREFLLENEIEFNEGARVLWEDVYFNTKVFTSGAKVAILADYPTYYWIATGANNSSSFGRDPHEKWAQIRKLIQFFVDTISNKEDLDFMLKHWYQSRVLGILGAWLLDKSEERIKIEFDYAKKVAENLIPAYIDENLTGINKVRSYLLRNGKINELKKLAKYDHNVTARSYATDIEWNDGKLKIAANAEMTFNEKSPYIMEERDSKIYRYIPEELKSIIPEQLLNLTEDMQNNRFEASIKGRNSRVTWETPADSSEIRIKTLDNYNITLEGNIEFLIDMENAAMGAPMNKQPWDIAARFSAVGLTFHRGIVGPEGYMQSALVEGKTAVVYRNKSALLSLDLGSKVHSVVSASKPKQSDLLITNENDKLKVVIKLPNTYVYGKTKIKGSIEFKPLDDMKVLNDNAEKQKAVNSDAYLIGDENGARVTTEVELPIGRYSISTKFEGRKAIPELYIIDRIPEVIEKKI